MPLDLEIVTEGTVAEQRHAADTRLDLLRQPISGKALAVLGVLAAAALGVIVYFVVLMWGFSP
jgi:hypothetical protein